jgi:hypothetical protein
MSETYELACIPCKKKLWIGQSQNSNPPFCFYSGEPDTMQSLKMFLWEHRGHSLIMDESQTLEITGVIPLDDDTDEADRQSQPE